ncbi:MAG: PadR family transcriptional regulator [Clostridia bacterium]|nr:PadR family transcriptional regulator [Clostridia bacterium]
MPGDVFKRGTVELAVLSVLQTKEMYGYQIVQTISELSGGKFVFPLGTLYPVLYRFVENGYVADRDEIVNGRLRKYYRMEPAGREYYRQLLEEYRRTAEGLERIVKGSEPDDG